jgi:hypothetical protein
MTPIDPNSPEAEGRYHNYVGNCIPWFVRVMWLGFWCIAVYYFVGYLFPDLQTELLVPR